MNKEFQDDADPHSAADGQPGGDAAQSRQLSSEDIELQESTRNPEPEPAPVVFAAESEPSVSQPSEPPYGSSYQLRETAGPGELPASNWPLQLPAPAPWADEPEWSPEYREPAGEVEDWNPYPGAAERSAWPEPGTESLSAEDAVGHGHRARAVFREVIETGLLALLVFLSVRATFQNFKVDGTSMFPTLHNGQFLIVNKLVYSQVDLDKLGKFVPFVDAGDDPTRDVFHGPQRGDIIVLKNPRNPDVDLIKRVIGLPGETLEIVEGKIYINGFRLDEPYIEKQWHDTRGAVSIPEGEYFVMGDNRDNSQDSREIGPIPRELIIGKAMLSYWPMSQFGIAPNHEGKVTTDAKPKITGERIGR